ncbi:hypothetical protein HID58_064248 [Brassica napus]|uniref:Cation-transporting P-type ATPase N-terminal domain-containing protein n=1 Tax=Brassica napus TaxID=3708 RepID=A0ABQ7Z9G1_BRANA|nr:hypothetical protein HID58_064248 [Brassica napus]
MYHRIPSLMEPILRRVSARWPVIVQATTWTVLLMVTVAVASFAPELAFVSTVSSSCGRGDGFVKIPMDFPGESVCVPSHMVKRSRFDLFMPPIFAAVMVTASACLIRSCFGTEDMDDNKRNAKLHTIGRSREKRKLSTSVKSNTFPAWAKTVGECEENFGVSRERGLTTENVLKRHQLYGLNELEKPEGTSIFKLILEQFNDTLVCILLAAAVISFVLAFVDGEEGGEMGITAFVEPLVIFLILIVNAIVGIWQETNAEKALEDLKEIQSQQATVMRYGNKVSSLPAKELVPGDIVDLRVGDKVPADMLVMALISSTLRVLVEKMGFSEGSTKASTLADGDVLHMCCCRLWSELEQQLATLEFDRDRKSMGVMVDSSSRRKLLLVKGPYYEILQGAVENVLERSTNIQLLDGSILELDQYLRDLILQNLHDMSMGALRCLGFAYSDVPSDFATYDGSEDHPAHQQLLNPSNYSSIESNLTFVGFVGLRDPLRKELRQAIADYRTAGIRVMVITEDNKSTAESICREIGVFEAGEDISSRSLTGKEFMDVKDQKNHLRQTGGLLLFKEDGEVIAMTGDGVNDAPALKLADIGVDMGIAGIEVAKEASDMVLADDNFSTIVAAVGEGMSISNNMKAFIRYMISSNIGEVASIFLTAALGIPEGMIPVQLLWVNLVTDGPPAMILGINPPDKDIMKKPRRRSAMIRLSLPRSSSDICNGGGIHQMVHTHNSFMGIDLSQDGHSLKPKKKNPKFRSPNFRNPNLISVDLTAETVESASLPLQSINHIHSSNSLPPRVLGVGDSVADDILEEDLEDSSGLLVDQTANTLDATSTSKTTNGRLGDTLDVIPKHLPVPLGSSLSQSFPPFPSS